MSRVVVYVARPPNARGDWRVSVRGRARQAHTSEDAAMRAASALARFLGDTGHEVAVKAEAEDGAWRIDQH